VNRQPRALLSVLLIGVVGFLGYRACNTTPADDGDGIELVISDGPTRGGTLTSSLRTEPRSFNRIMARDTPADLYSHLAGGKLVRVNRATQELEPSVAESWTTSPDNKTFTLTLRDGVTWSDGTPFTSADVLFTFDTIYNAKPESALASGLRIGGKPLAVSAPDAKTVVITLPSTFGPGIGILDNVYLAARHKYEALHAAGKFAEAMNAATPPADIVSLGPFKLASYTSGQRLLFDRNPHYWKKDAAGIQLPYLDQVVFEIVPDQNAELVRLQGGQLDTLQQQVRLEDLATLRPLEQQGKLKIIEVGVNPDPDVFFFNLRSPYWAKDPRREWITRKEFRHAISHAIDREMYANTVYLGAGVPIWGPITTGNKVWFSPNVKRYGYSPDRAKEILAELGLTNRDADEWLEDAKGTEAAFNVIAYRGNTSIEKGAQILRDELKKIGIRVDVVLLEQGALVQRMLKGDFESIFFLLGSTSLDPAMNSDLWLSSGSAHVWNMGQPVPATEWEKQIDDLMGIVMTNVDQAERKRAFDEVQKIFAEHLPAIHFVAPRLYVGVSSRVGGITPAILRPQLLWDVERMTVQGAR
jgi:peptide/nickel transport system substrate-binding protein